MTGRMGGGGVDRGGSPRCPAGRGIFLTAEQTPGKVVLSPTDNGYEHRNKIYHAY